MDVERTMEFILEQQAKNQELLANLLAAQAEAELRSAAAERRIDRLDNLLARLARLGVKSRSRLNGRLGDHEKRLARHDALLDRIETNLAEATEKLNALIGVVDRWPRNAS